MHGGAHAGAHIGGAGSYYTIVLTLGAASGDNFFHSVDQLLQVIEHQVQQVAFLHAHDAQMVLLAQPDDVLLVVREPAAAALRPVGGDAGLEQEEVLAHVLEHDVGLDELVVALFVDKLGVAGGEGDLLASEIALDEFLEDLAHVLLEVDAVFAGHGAWQGLLAQVASGADAHGELGEAEVSQVELPVFGEAFSAADVPAVNVLGGVEVDFVVTF